MDRITLEPGKRGGRPCVRNLRITVYDVLSMLSSGMSTPEILDDFPELTEQDILVEPTAETTMMDIAKIQLELARLLPVAVDVLTPKGLPAKFRDQVIAEAQVI